MSFKARKWADQQPGLKPATKVVLVALCDRHNPQYGCFPSQERLAKDCGISRSTLNRCLKALEAKGLIRREPQKDMTTKRQRSTRYILAFEERFDLRTAEPCPDFGLKAVSRKNPKPCVRNGKSRVSKSDTNPVREPLMEPVREAGREGAPTDISDEFFSRLLETLGYHSTGSLPSWWRGRRAREHVQYWRDSLGLTETQILEIAEKTRRIHPMPPDGPKALDRAMEAASRKIRRSKNHHSESFSTEERKLHYYADLVNSDRYFHPGTLLPSLCDELISKGLVTPERLRERRQL